MMVIHGMCDMWSTGEKYVSSSYHFSITWLCVLMAIECDSKMVKERFKNFPIDTGVAFSALYVIRLTKNMKDK